MQDVDNITELSDVLKHIWEELGQGASNSHSAYHTPVFASLSEGGSSLRTVVLRKVVPEERAIVCHTDIRAAKVTEIERNRAVSWLFYAPEEKIQIRAEGTATVHHQDEIAEAAWQATKLMSRRAYMASPGPGTPTDRPESGLPENMLNRSPLQDESEVGWANFGVIVSTIGRFDWVYLAAKGHRRAQFDWQDAAFVGSWLIP